MNILFIGGIFSASREGEIVQKTIKRSVQYAANKFQWSIINGLLEIGEGEVEIVSAPFIGTYPFEYKDIFFNKEKELYKNKIEIKYVSFLNIWGIRNIFRKISLIHESKKIMKKKNNVEKILVYSPHTPFLQAAIKIKKENPDMHICLIVPDVPLYMNLDEKKSILYKLFKKIDIFLFNNLLKKVDSFVLITKEMKNILNIGNKPYVVVEGIIDEAVDEQKMGVVEKRKTCMEFCSDIKYIVYTGTLREKFGVINLIKAFMLIEDIDVSLVICGTGDILKEVKRYAKEDGRIICLGQISNLEAKSVQNNATILINPRPNDEDFTKYSFPYKNFEYLLTGKPVIGFKLDGIPDEYDEFLYYIPRNDIVAIKDKIIEVLNTPESYRTKLGEKAREFLLSEKKSSKACEKILNIMEKSDNYV